MTKTPFFARKTLGQPNYLLVAMACAFVLALVPRAAWRALDSTSTNVEAWLPPTDGHVQDLDWFRRHFRGEQFALISWDGCTLGNDEQLELLAKKLAASSPVAGASSRGANWYSRVTTGPQVIRELMTAHVGVSYADAIKRIEGALVGPPQRDAHGHTLGNESRATCLVVDFAPAALADGASLRAAVAGISQIAAAECGIDPATIHMGGPPVDKVTIDAESRHTLLRLAPLAGLLGVGLCYWRLRSARLTAIIFALGVVSAALSLAIVFYAGVFEVVALGRAGPQWGVLDAVVIAMPAVVYLLAISAAAHAANYYLQVRHEQGVAGAAEVAARYGLRPAILAAVASAAALAALAANDIVPIQRFGLFAALSVLAMAAVIYGIMPMVLHRYPPGDALVRRRAAPGRGGLLAERSRSAMQSLTAHPALTLSAVAIAFAVVGAGVLRLNASVQVFQLLNEDADLIRDYAWLEKHLGNLVPMEVVVALPPERLRTGDEHAEADGQQYRMTMLDRLELLRQIERRLEAFPQISRALSATAFAPPATATGLGGANRSGDYAKNKALEFHAEKFLAGDYVSLEIDPATHRPTGRELWRLNARVAAMSAGNKPIDYSVFLGQLQRAVEPVLLAYQQRDQIVRALHEQGKQLAGSRVCVLFRAPGQAPAPPAEVQEQALAELLTVSGVAPRGVTYFNLATFEQPDRGNPAQDELFRTSALASLQKQDAVVLASAPSDPVARQIAASGVYVVNVTAVHKALESIAAPMVDDGGPRPIRAVFTGIAPVVEQTQQLLAASLVDNLAWAAVLAAVAITLGYMSLASGALTIGPALLPLAATLGAMGWLGFKIELGVAMTAGVALGVALEGGMHLIQWYRRGLATGLARREAVIWAHDRVSTTIVDAALIAAAGLAVFALSAFTPLRQFGVVMIVMQLAALATNLLVLPAILASPLGWFFAPAVARRADPLLPKIQNWWSSVRPRHVASHGAVLPLPKAPPAPHYGDQPVPRRTTLPISTSERRELSEGPHSALHAKLQGLRRPRAEDSAT